MVVALKSCRTVTVSPLWSGVGGGRGAVVGRDGSFVGFGRRGRAVALVAVSPLEERAEVEDRVVDARVEVTEAGEALGHRRDGEVLRLRVTDLVPREPRGDRAARVAPHAVG